MMTETNFDSCEVNYNVPFCNGASPFYIFVRKNGKSYAHNRDCIYDWSYCKNETPAEMCVFSPHDIEAWDKEGEKDIHTSDYIEGEDVE